MLEKRGQAALEYLMTYGWALVVIVIVIAALVFLINPSQIGASGCTGFSKFPIKNYKAATNSFKLIATNQTGLQAKDVNITYFGKVSGSVIPTAESDAVGSIAANAEKEFTYNAFAGTTGDPYDLNFNVAYRDPDGYDRNATATCKGTI